LTVAGAGLACAWKGSREQHAPGSTAPGLLGWLNAVSCQPVRLACHVEVAQRKWLKGLLAALLQDAVKSVIAGLGLSALIGGVILRFWPQSWEFLRATHPVRGWFILLGALIVVLFLASATLNGVQWRRRTRQRTFSIVADGHPTALHWNMGGVADRPAMMVTGDFYITNLSSHNLGIARTELVMAYKIWGVIPWRRHVQGTLAGAVMPARKQTRDRFIWFIEPPILKEGQQMRARVVMIDTFNDSSKSDWYRWRYL